MLDELIKLNGQELPDWIIKEEGEMERLNGPKITDRQIVEGVPHSASACPIALAMQGLVNGIPQVFPSNTIIFQGGIATYIIKHTGDLTDWINRYDRGGYGNGQITAPGPITLKWTESGYLGIKQQQGAG